MTIRRLLVLALMAGIPKVASAQFTTFIPPRNVVADSVKAAVVAAQKTQTDSVSHVQLTNMKTWVDSAAGIVPAPATSVAADSVAQRMAAADTSTFRNGMRAPATASDLPLLLVVGLAMLLLGLFLRGAPPQPARARSRRRA